jgi:SNF2 family DNA or RNA helicase
MSFFEFESEQPTSPEIKEVAAANEVESQVATELSSTAVEILNKERRLQELETIIEPSRTRMQEIREQVHALRMEMQAKIDVLQTESQELESKIFDTRREIRNLKVEIDALRRRLAIELEQQRQQEAFKTNVLEYSKTIANYSYMEKILPHQKEGAFILATAGRAILGDKRGLGKTLTSLATADALQAQKILVLCPDDVLSNFVNEIHYWAPHRTVFPIGKMPKAQRDFAFDMASKVDQFIMVCNYSAWRKDKSMLDSFVKLGLEMVIADEAHELKNTSTSAFKGVKKIVLSENCCPMCKSMDLTTSIKWEYGYYDKCNKCDWQSNSSVHEWSQLDRCSVRYMFPMTGTVILNKPQDLFALLHLVDPVVFSDEYRYLAMYCTQDYYTGKWVFQTGGLERLTGRLAGKFLARDEKSAGVIRPKQSIIIHEIEFDKDRYHKQWRVIEQLSKHAQIILDSGKTMNPLATITLILRKRQANVYPAGITVKNENGDVVFSVADDVTESVKLDKCIDDNGEGLIAEFTENGDKELGARVVVFSQFKGPLADLERRLTHHGISVVRFDGDTPEQIRSQVKVDFDRKICEDPDYNNGLGYKWQVCLANYRTGGVGLNFTAATETIFLDEEWNPGKADQAMGRTDRIGQTEETNVHILRIPGTIDTWMVQLNEQKQEIIDGFERSASDTAKSLLDAMKNGDIV